MYYYLTKYSLYLLPPKGWAPPPKAGGDTKDDGAQL